MRRSPINPEWTEICNHMRKWERLGPDHCVRCLERMAPEEEAYFVTPPQGEGWGRKPACSRCVTDEDAREPRRRVVCGGCGRPIVVADGDRRVACSERCGQRMRRKARRQKRHECIVCRTSFRATRRDARTCSARCRMTAHRKAVLAAHICEAE